MDIVQCKVDEVVRYYRGRTKCASLGCEKRGKINFAKFKGPNSAILCPEGEGWLFFWFIVKGMGTFHKSVM